MRLLLALSSLAAAQPALDARLEAMQASIDALTRTVSAQATELAALKAAQSVEKRAPSNIYLRLEVARVARPRAIPNRFLVGGAVGIRARGDRGSPDARVELPADLVKRRRRRRPPRQAAL